MFGRTFQTYGYIPRKFTNTKISFQREWIPDLINTAGNFQISEYNFYVFKTSGLEDTTREKIRIKNIFHGKGFDSPKFWNSDPNFIEEIV